METYLDDALGTLDANDLRYLRTAPSHCTSPALLCNLSDRPLSLFFIESFFLFYYYITRKGAKLYSIRQSQIPINQSNGPMHFDLSEP